MANIVMSALVAQASGSVGGVTFSRGRGGAIARARVKPINPRSVLQSTRRANAAHLAKYWSNDLTQQQRDDWEAYSAGTNWNNKLGQSIEINGNAAFLRHNTLTIISGVSIRPAAPLAMGHAGGVPFTFSAENDTGNIQMDLPTGSFDKDTEYHQLLLFMGLPTQPGQLTAPKGFRYLGIVYGNSATPLTFPHTLATKYTMQAGQRITLRGMFQDENFRNSGSFFATAIAAPSG